MKNKFSFMAIRKDALVYGTSTIGTKGQIVIPARMRKELNLKEGDTLIFIGSPYREAFNIVKVGTVQELTQGLTKLLSGKQLNEKK